MTVPQHVRSILIVEDNEADADLAMESLSSAAALNVRVVQDGRAALDCLRENEPGGATAQPDLILLDLNLPRQGGLATLADIKGDPALRRIPVVVLTTSKSSDEIGRSYELGAAAVLNKPMRLNDYRSMLSAFQHFWLEHVRYPRETG